MTIDAHPIEQTVGMEHYVSETEGIGGVLRTEPDDFHVTELEAFSIAPLSAEPGGYPEIVLRVTLRSWDTNDFARRLSNALSMSRERVSWAGTKDKHAVTTQLFTVSKADPDEIDALDIDGATIEVLGRAGRPLSFGDLYGNRFSIRVRDAETSSPVPQTTTELAAFAGDESEIDTSEPVTVGVPNYFGHQRFGSYRPITHEVGLRIVRDDWRGAVLSYVGSPSESEPERTRSAREFVDAQAERETPDWNAALDRMPGHLRYERSMLHRLLEDGATTDEDFRHALESVPSNLQRLFVNAAQSYIFNRILSERLSKGLPFDRPIAGDVCCFADRDAPDGLYAPDDHRLQQVTEKRVQTMERHCKRGRAFVTAPLVGTETELADGAQGEIERAILSELEIEPPDFSLPGNFDSTGTRRAILVRTDLTVDPDELRFAFSLPSGSYATVLLREYLKTGPLEL